MAEEQWVLKNSTYIVTWNCTQNRLALLFRWSAASEAVDIAKTVIAMKEKKKTVPAYNADV